VLGDHYGLMHSTLVGIRGGNSVIEGQHRYFVLMHELAFVANGWLGIAPRRNQPLSIAFDTHVAVERHGLLSL
jgi:hypothetical protein